MSVYEKYIKRILDFIFSLFFLIVLSPLLGVVALLVRFNLGSPIIFKQKRPGRYEKLFKIYKFRTMTDEVDENGCLLGDKDRLTKLGIILRNSSIDELPELINIIRGDMSIVGPRPQLVKDMVFFDSIQMKRQSFKPGLTGLAQVNGRNNITWEKKILLDLEYTENITFISDMKIILKTIVKVFKHEDINSDGLAAGEDFGDYLLRTQKIERYEFDVKIEKSKKMLDI